MTPDQIDAMEAGREMDAVVARGIWGWTDVVHNAYVPYGRDTCGWNPNGNGRGYNGSNRMTVPAYSTQLLAAWPIVIKFEKDGWQWILESNYVDEVELRGWKVSLTLYRPEFGLHNGATGAGRWPMDAICRAALRAELRNKESE